VGLFIGQIGTGTLASEREGPVALALVCGEGEREREREEGERAMLGRTWPGLTPTRVGDASHRGLAKQAGAHLVASVLLKAAGR
jgi:hypothetical protein